MRVYLYVRSFLGVDFYASTIFCCYMVYLVGVNLFSFKFHKQVVLHFIKLTVTSCYHLRNGRIMCE